MRLLTYVSIFYLPLAFCASIWAIPNILDSKTTRSFAVTAITVGIATYAVVLNLDTIASKVKKHYDKQKRKVIQQMQVESQQDWRKIGERFQEFKPSMENKVPSEWWIVVFAIRRFPWYMGGLWRKTANLSYRIRLKAINSLRRSPEKHGTISPTMTNTSSTYSTV